jgi:hypothetical protein
LAALASEHTDHLAAGGAITIWAVNAGYHWAFAAAAGLVAAAIVVGFLVLRLSAEGPRASEPSTATATRA